MSDVSTVRDLAHAVNCDSIDILREKNLRTKMKKILVALLFAGLFSAETVCAQDFSTPFQSGSRATLSLEGGSSYACYVFGVGDYTLSLNVEGPSGETITAVYPAAPQKALETFLKTAFTFGDTTLTNNLISFSTTNGSAGFGNYKITMASAGVGSANPTVNCVSTALSCSFNSYISDSIYLELTNTGFNNALVSFLTLDYAGTTANANAAVPVGLRSDVAVHPLVGASNYGSVIIRPLIAPPFFGESVRARVSHYKGGVLQNIEVCQPVASNNVG